MAGWIKLKENEMNLQDLQKQLFNHGQLGTQYMEGYKNKKLCTVTDILKTYNSKGDFVKLRYVATHEFCGQAVTDYDVNQTTIARGIA